jgi:hypothetical protein
MSGAYGVDEVVEISLIRDLALMPHFSIRIQSSPRSLLSEQPMNEQPALLQEACSALDSDNQFYNDGLSSTGAIRVAKFPHSHKDNEHRNVHRSDNWYPPMSDSYHCTQTGSPSPGYSG